MTLAESNQAKANQILKELVGSKLMYMTNTQVHSWKTNEKGDVVVLFKLKMKNQIAAKFMEITLNALDLYDVVYFSMKRSSFERIIKSESLGIYNDMFRKDFEKTTGLHTNL